MRPRAVSWLVLTAGVSAAQGPPVPPLFPSAVDQVVVDVVVLDERGSAVAGLSREDFLLTEDGAPQQVLSFEAVEAPPAAGSVQATAPRPPGATSGASASPAARRTIALVFDDLGLSPPQGERARAALADFVRDEVRNGDQLSLASTSGRYRWVARTAEEIEDLLEVLALLQGLATSDLSGVRMTDDEAYRIHVERDPRAAGQVAGRYLAAGVALRGPALEQLVSADAGSAYQRALTRARQTLAVLERSARSLQGVRGRKALILVSPGFFHEAEEAVEYRRVLEACREASVAVYFVNAAGLEAPSLGLDTSPISPFTSPDAQRIAGEPGTDQEEAASAFPAHDRAATFGADSFAEDTGGFVVRNTNDLAGGLRRVAEDSRAYYLLGYVSTNGARDGRYRKIAVRLSPPARANRQGRTVRARRGYYGPSEATPNRAVSAEDELQRLLDSPAERGDVPVRLAAFLFEDSTRTRGAIRCVLVSEVDDDTAFDLAYETVPRGEGRGERALKRVTPTGDRSVGGWVRLEQELALSAGVHQVTVAVRDAAGRSGSRSIRLEVPPTGSFRISTPGSFRISTPVVAPWRGAGGTLQPHAAAAGGRGFATGDHVQIAFEVYGARKDPATGRPRVSTGCAIVRAGQGARGATLRPVGQDQQDALHRAIDFELAGVGVGEYLFIGRVADEVAGEEVTFSAPFAVTAPAGSPQAKGESAQPTAAPELASLLELAGSYVVGYEEALHDLAAEEEYTQRAPRAPSPEASALTRDAATPTGSAPAIRASIRDSGQELRLTRADVVFARLAPPFPWATFRDVFEANGAAVRDRDGRLERAFRDTPRTAVEQAKVILAESARYNIGPERTVNLPTLPLLFLHPANQPRFAFERRGKSDDGAAVELAFREQARPTMIRTSTGTAIRGDATAPRPLQGEGDLPAEGRFWINARRGTVLRSEVRFHFGFGETATITTTYRAEPSLAMWVPAEMKERYEGGGFGVGTDAVARYSRFRKFEVAVEEKARVPEK